MLHLVVRHRRDPDQPWKGNVWLDDNRLEAIETEKETAGECEAARLAGETVRIHRCAHGGGPVVCSEARVTSVESIDKKTSLVRFEAQVALNEAPPVMPVRRQNHYRA